MPRSPFPPGRRPAGETDLAHPIRGGILRACSERARTVAYLATLLDVTPQVVRSHLQHLIGAKLLAAEAPIRIAGRVVIHYRTMPLATRASARSRS